MILGSVPLSWCRVECDRRRTAKLIHPSPSGSRRGRMHRRRTLSGSSGVTIRSEGNVNSFRAWNDLELVVTIARDKTKRADPVDIAKARSDLDGQRKTLNSEIAKLKAVPMEDELQ